LKSARTPAFMLCAVSILTMLIFFVSSGESGGGELSSILMTFLHPALLVLVLGYAGQNSISLICRFMPWLFIVNSALGLIEAATNFRTLPFVAAEVLVNFDPRPTALFGHPLVNSLLTGGWVLLLLMKAFKSTLRLRDVPVFALHIIAMLAFGGRAAFVTCVGVLALYVVIHSISRAWQGYGRKEFAKAVALISVAFLSVPIILYSGAADGILSRVADSRGSNETRLAAFEMVQLLSPAEWLIGVPNATREYLLRTLGTEYGVEISWVGLLLSYGLPLTVLLLFSMFWILTSVGKKIGDQGAYATLYFAIVTFTSTSISGKTLIISAFLAMYVAMFDRRPFDDNRQHN